MSAVNAKQERHQRRLFKMIARRNRKFEACGVRVIGSHGTFIVYVANSIWAQVLTERQALKRAHAACQPATGARAAWVKR
jgi:hypothetical protein